MPESKNILINNRFNSGQASVNSNLTLTDDYYTYVQTSLGGGITTEFNVRQFLSDETNDDVGNDFFNFLTANTTTQEFRNIFNSNQKLSSVFNTYYERSVVNSQASGKDFINTELTGTSKVTIWTPNTFEWSESKAIDLYGTKMPGEIDSFISPERKGYGSKGRAILTNISEEESYYVPVFLKQSNTQAATINFENLSRDCYKDIDQPDGTVKKTLVKQCFVDINQSLSSDINSLYASISVNSINFGIRSVSVDEGDSYDLTINLAEPSIQGTEEVSVVVDTETTTALDSDYDFVVDGRAVIGKELTFSFSPGESSKTFTIRAKEDFTLDDSNRVMLKFNNVFNVSFSEQERLEVLIINTTRFADMQILPNLQFTTYGERAGGVSPDTGIVVQSQNPPPGFVNEISIQQNVKPRNQPAPETAFGLQRAFFNEDTSYGNSVYSNFDSRDSTYLASRSISMEVRYQGTLRAERHFRGADTGAVRIMKIARNGTRTVIADNQVNITTGTGRGQSTYVGYPFFVKTNVRNTNSPYELDFDITATVNLDAGERMYFEFGGSVPNHISTTGNGGGTTIDIWIQSGRFDITSINGGEQTTEARYINQNAGQQTSIPVTLSFPSGGGFEVGSFSLTQLDIPKAAPTNLISLSNRSTSFNVGEDEKPLFLLTPSSAVPVGQSVYRVNFDGAEKATPVGVRSFDVVVRK